MSSDTEEIASPPTPSSPSSLVRRPPAPILDGAQRRYLRSLAHPLKPIVFVGEAGVSPALINALDEALASHELVKVKLRGPTDKKATANELADASASALCGVVGHTVVLYRPDPDKPRIVLPQRP